MNQPQIEYVNINVAKDAIKQIENECGIDFIDNLKELFNVDDLAVFYTSIWNVIIKVKRKYSHDPIYCDFKGKAMIVDMYDKLKPNCSFEDFICLFWGSDWKDKI